MKKLLMLLSLALCSNGLAAGVFVVTAPGPLNSNNIVLQVLNDDTYAIESISFDLTSTALPLIIDPAPFDVVDPAGGTSTYVQTDVSHWGFTFTGFDTGDSFAFAWDPDIAGDPSFGATVADQAGMGISIGTSAGTVSGTLFVVGDHLEARIDSPTERVPDSGSTAVLFGSALTGVAGLRRLIRRK